ncbi:hypothetical protein A946_06175 [Methylacidiphilum kamchatkense Kam1]|nr:hypothetical protein A946_06175 [Methylacidiphilum kamchatkense Kam1]
MSRWEEAKIFHQKLRKDHIVYITEGEHSISSRSAEGSYCHKPKEGLAVQNLWIEGSQGQHGRVYHAPYRLWLGGVVSQTHHVSAPGKAPVKLQPGDWIVWSSFGHKH